jgi:hypothetical protein
MCHSPPPVLTSDTVIFLFFTMFYTIGNVLGHMTEITPL